MNHRSLLKFLLLAGFVYFFSMAAAHMIGWKAPGLFIYFDIPSYAYQDRIISVLAMGWSLFFLQAGLNPKRNTHTIRTLLTAGLLALIGLSINTLTTNFALLNPSADQALIWIQIAVLFVYLLLLMFSYKKIMHS